MSVSELFLCLLNHMGQRDITSLSFGIDIISNVSKSVIHTYIVNQICRAILNLSLTGYPVESAISSRSRPGGL